MEYLIPLGLFILTAAIIYLIVVSNKNSGVTGTEAQNLLVQNLRDQLTQAQKTAQQEALLKTQALQSSAVWPTPSSAAW